MSNPTRAKRSLWPCPVYVARFSDGTECRMSFWSDAKKPLDFDRGRRGCCQAIGNERGRAVGTIPGTRYAACYQHYAPATDIEYGEVEYGGEVMVDPFFAAPAPVVPLRPKADPLAALLAKVGKLDWAQLEALQAAIDARVAA